MKNSYPKLVISLVLSFCIMYAVMFLNVDDASHIYLSLTRFYMALLMVCPMAILMIALMGGMYQRKGLNRVIMISSLLVFAVALIGLRRQVLVTDEQYMKAMIPHHSSAVMTSRHARLTNPAVRQLADSIIHSQEREIALMKSILKEQ